MESREASAVKAEASAIFLREFLTTLGNFLFLAAFCAQMKAARDMTELADAALKEKEDSQSYFPFDDQWNSLAKHPHPPGWKMKKEMLPVYQPQAL